MKKLLPKPLLCVALTMLAAANVYSQSDTTKDSSGKNILNNRKREFFRVDEVPFRVMAGINYEF